MGGGPQIISDMVIDDASAAELMKGAQRLLAAAYGKVSAGGENLSQEELVDQALLAQRVQNCGWAIQSRRLAQASGLSQRGIDGDGDDVGDGAGDGGAEWFPVEVAARLGWSDRQAGARLGQACEVLDWTPVLVDLAGEGNLDARKVTAVANVTAGAPGHVAAEVEARIVAGDPKGVTSTKLAAKARRLLAKLAPVEADEAGEDRRRKLVGVFVSPHHEPGLSELTAVMPTLDAAKLMAAIDTHARELQEASTTAKTLPESRVDALTDLVLNGAVVDTQLTLVIPLAEPAPVGSVAPVEATAESVGAESAGAEVAGAGSVVESPQSVVEAPQSVAEGVAVPARELVGAGASGVSGVLFPSGRAGWTVADWSQHTDEAERDAQWAALAALNNEVLITDHEPGPSRAVPPDTGSPPQLAHGVHQHSQRAERSKYPGDPVRFEDVLLPRVGVIPGSVIQDLVQSLGMKLSRALADPVTGVIAETGDKTYRPGAALLRFVKARDQHCRFPGCTHPAARCDLDHVVRHPDGPTAAHNLQALCRHHHRAKHEGGWKVTMTGDGVCTWTSPTGRSYITQPAD